MENIKKERLSELILKKDQALGASSNYDVAYEWLEELEYLLNSLKNLGPIATKVMETIKSLRDNEFRYPEDISIIKAKLEVFKRYEFDNAEFE